MHERGHGHKKRGNNEIPQPKELRRILSPQVNGVFVRVKASSVCLCLSVWGDVCVACYETLQHAPVSKVAECATRRPLTRLCHREASEPPPSYKLC